MSLNNENQQKYWLSKLPFTRQMFQLELKVTKTRKADHITSNIILSISCFPKKKSG